MITLSLIRAAKILIVNDHEASTTSVEHMLRDAGYTAVTSTADLYSVPELHKVHRYDLIIFDLNTSDANSFQVLPTLKQADVHLSVLTITTEHKQQALDAGATDFVTTPLDPVEVLTRIRNLLEVRLLYTQSSRHGLRLTRYDTLTGLPNRTLFHESLNRTLQQAEKHQLEIAVLFIDLDRFKNVNDTLGHAAGDELLEQFAQRLVDCMRMSDTVSRLGGDEFAVIWTIPMDQQDVVFAVDTISAALHQPFHLDNHEVIATASIGIALYPDDALDTDTLIKYADTALFQAKEAGRDTYRFFTDEMNVQVQSRLALESALRKAIDHHEFTLHYQPKVQVATGRITGVEALLRWNRPGHGLVLPSEFVPLLEETGLIVRVGAWVIDTVCRQIAEWKRSLAVPPCVAINVSGRQCVDGDLEFVIMDAMREHGIEPELLELEITESALMDNVEQTADMLRNLKRSGVRISIDDFGTGYSSLTYLKRFPIDALKIDIGLIRDITTNPDDAAIALAIIGMAHSLKLDAIAEGVETAAQLAYLSRHRCDQIQGFHFSCAVPAQELEQMLRNNKSLELPAGDATPPPWTLLLVDDEENVLNALKRLLRQDGYRILTASSAAEGFELLALNPVHIIISDQRMPQMSGIEFLDKVKEMYPDTFRIVLSGYTDTDTIMDAINRSALYRFFTKPWDSNVLRENIRAAFRHYWQLHGMPADNSAKDRNVQ